MRWKHAAFAAALVLAQTSAHAEENKETLRTKVNAIFADLMVEGAPGCCHSNANSSPFDTKRPTLTSGHAISDCHSARAAERVVL